MNWPLIVLASFVRAGGEPGNEAMVVLRECLFFREGSIMELLGVWVQCCTFKGDALAYNASQQTIIVIGFCMNYCLVNTNVTIVGHLYN